MTGMLGSLQTELCESILVNCGPAPSSKSIRPEIRCPYIPWIMLVVKCGASDREIESLIPVHQRDLRMRSEKAVVAHLSRGLRTANKISARRRVIPVKMREGIPTRCCDRRLRCEIFGDVCDANVHDARRPAPTSPKRCRSRISRTRYHPATQSPATRWNRRLLRSCPREGS